MERDKTQGLDPSKTTNSLKTAEDVKAHLENQLKQARLAAQQVWTLNTTHTQSFTIVNQVNKSICIKCCNISVQKRLEQRLSTTATTSTTTTTTTSASIPSTLGTPASTGQRTGQVASGNKMVLASKHGSPVSFQQDKNFHQSFASWVKQGQPNNSPGEPIIFSPSLHACSCRVVPSDEERQTKIIVTRDLFGFPFLFFQFFYLRIYLFVCYYYYVFVYKKPVVGMTFHTCSFCVPSVFKCDWLAKIIFWLVVSAYNARFNFFF